MARSNAARREPENLDDRDAKAPDATRGRAADTAARAQAGQSAANRKTPADLDRVIHERMRLAIVSALAGAETLSFNELKELLDITDGNLSVHAKRLEEAGFVACEKSFVDRVPRTRYQLTAAGRKALDDYLDHMESLIRRVREG
jgi:DNA-binding MarR family transcriptional regulator